MKDIVANLWSLYYSIGLVGLEVVESNSTRETHLTHPDLYPTRFDFFKTQTDPIRFESDLTRIDLKSNDFQSNRNLLKI
jgi:hypothetical protein